MWLPTLVLTLALAVLDNLCVRAGLSARADLTLRFFLVHCVVNTLIIVYVLPDTLRVLRSPESAIFAPFHPRPLQLVVALHLYHMKDYRHLTTVDWVHHLSVLALAGLTHSHRGRGPGPLCNFCLFFICGLPGLIDYCMLVARRWNRLSSLTEKKWNTVLHVWIRCPGLIAYGVFAYAANAITGWRIPLSRLAFFVVPVIFNGIYFAHRVCQNYGYNLALHRQ